MQVTEPAGLNLSRWRHGFEPRWATFGISNPAIPHDTRRPALEVGRPPERLEMGERPVIRPRSGHRESESEASRVEGGSHKTLRIY